MKSSSKADFFHPELNAFDSNDNECIEKMTTSGLSLNFYSYAIFVTVELTVDTDDTLQELTAFLLVFANTTLLALKQELQAEGLAWSVTLE